MKVSVLASGSKGNSTYLETKNHKILIDMGMNTKYIENKLIELGIEPSSIDSIFITHDHTDHISALKVFIKKYNPKVYLTAKLKKVIDITNYEIIKDVIILNDLTVDTIKTSHDATDSVGYIFDDDTSSLVYITDTGYINSKYFEKLHNKKMYIIESNHDIEKLMNGRYRYDLKIRILSDRGHLSNEMTSKYLDNFIGNNTKYIILAHLSEENNTEKLAHDTLYSILKEKLDNKQVIIAKQTERTDLIEV